jgi:hypothetical protein
MCDGYLGLIREKQITYDGYEYGVGLPDLDISGFCRSLSLDHVADAASLLNGNREWWNPGGPTVVTVRARDSQRMAGRIRVNRLKKQIKDKLGPRRLAKIRKLGGSIGLK